MKTIDEIVLPDKIILLRGDYNVSFADDGAIADDLRITESLPTLKLLLRNNNKLILVSHLGKPKGKEHTFSLKPICQRLKKYLPDISIVLVDDFHTLKKADIENAPKNTIFVLENIRFFKEEKENDPVFAKELASLADIFVNDAFGVSHREDASVVGVPKLLPSFAGLLLKKEIAMIEKVTKNPTRPYVAIIGGAKISTKLGLIDKLATLSDHVLLGGGLANTLLKAKGYEIGKSLCENDVLEVEAKRLIAKHNDTIQLPTDVIVENGKGEMSAKNVETLHPDDAIFDIGPKTQEQYQTFIRDAKTIVWNGPVGYFEKKEYKAGTDGIYQAIIANQPAVSLLGGGDTITAIANMPNHERITHISTGGGAMLEFIEKGTLPGIEALG